MGERPLRACVTAALVVVLGSAHAGAQTSDIEKAQAHFDAGRKHRAQGRCDLAIEEFSQAVDFEPNKVGPRLNLGDCYAELGRYSDAFRQFKEAERLADLAKDQRRLASARKSAADVEAKMVRVVLRAEEPDANITVDVDGVSYGTAPWHIVVAPSADHEVHAKSPDGRTWTARASGQAGQVVRLTIALAKPALAPVRTSPVAEPGALPPHVEPEAKSNGLRTASFIVGGAGIVGLAVGATFGAFAMSSRSDLADAVQSDTRCSGTYPGSCSPEARTSLQPIYDRASSQATISTVAFIAGGALLAGGVGLFLLSRGDGKADVRATVGPGSAMLEGRF